MRLYLSNKPVKISTSKLIEDTKLLIHWADKVLRVSGAVDQLTEAASINWMGQYDALDKIQELTDTKDILHVNGNGTISFRRPKLRSNMATNALDGTISTTFEVVYSQHTVTRMYSRVSKVKKTAETALKRLKRGQFDKIVFIPTIDQTDYYIKIYSSRLVKSCKKCGAAFADKQGLKDHKNTLVCIRTQYKHLKRQLGYHEDWHEQVGKLILEKKIPGKVMASTVKVLVPTPVRDLIRMYRKQHPVGMTLYDYLDSAINGG